jgi:hypothetical protein
MSGGVDLDVARDKKSEESEGNHLWDVIETQAFWERTEANC